MIVLVSDGKETCGGDPVAVAKQLIADVKASPWIAEAPEVQSEDYKDGIFLHELKFYKTKVYKGQDIKAVMLVKKSPYEAHNNIINQTFFQ